MYKLWCREEVEVWMNKFSLAFWYRSHFINHLAMVISLYPCAPLKGTGNEERVGRCAEKHVFDLMSPYLGLLRPREAT